MLSWPCSASWRPYWPRIPLCHSRPPPAKALAKPGKYQAELYCALHEISLPVMEDLSAQLASLEAVNLPPGWTQEWTSPVDFLLRCLHDVVLRDTIAERAGQVVACCPQGCTPPAGLTAQA